MSKMQRQSLVAYGQPLCETIVDCPKPRGSEVLVRIERCGVCHSDLHLQDGYFALGGDKKLDVSAGRALPFTLGHEIAGVIESAGEDAADAKIGHRVAVYPWIGCGVCAACRGGEENLCSNHRHLGIAVDDGFARLRVGGVVSFGRASRDGGVSLLCVDIGDKRRRAEKRARNGKSHHADAAEPEQQNGTALGPADVPLESGVRGQAGAHQRPGKFRRQWRIVEQVARVRNKHMRSEAAIDGDAEVTMV